MDIPRWKGDFPKNGVETDYAPFGETYASRGTLDAAYTGQMDDSAQRRDTAGGLYDFPLREYSTQGRWPSTDPVGISGTCVKDPQSQNRCAYVRNNPITRIDPNGMGDCSPDDPASCGGSVELSPSVFWIRQQLSCDFATRFKPISVTFRIRMLGRPNRLYW